MKRAGKTGLAIVLLLVCSLTALAREETVQELKAQAESANASDRAKLALEIARRQLDAADKAYTAGQVPEAQTLLADVVTYAQKAGDAARKARKHIKRTEIEVRKMSRRLQEIKPNLEIDNREPVQDAINHLEHVRTELLMDMFSER